MHEVSSPKTLWKVLVSGGGYPSLNNGCLVRAGELEGLKFGVYYQPMTQNLNGRWFVV